MEGTLTRGKKIATGVTASSVGKFGFINQSGSNIQHYILQVAGLDFNPSTVIIFDREGLKADIVYNSDVELWLGKKLYVFIPSTNGMYYSMEGNSSVDKGKFSFPALYGNTNYKWIAFE